MSNASDQSTQNTPVYLAADAGGTKLQLILYTHDLQIVALGTTGGTNTTFKNAEVIEAEIEETVAALFAEAEQNLGRPITEIERFHCSMVGGADILSAALGRRAIVKQTCGHGEGEVALAASCVDEGIVAQAGTGSDAFFIQIDPITRKTVQRIVGGWGSLLGDEGSGYQIGLKSIIACIYAKDGRGPFTELYPLLMKEWDMKDLWDSINIIQGDKDSRKRIANVAKLTSFCARNGDAVAQRIYREAGRDLALQVNTVIAQNGGTFRGPVVASGGAWKGYSGMLDAMREEICRVHPDALVQYTAYEPIIGSVYLCAKETHPNDPTVRAKIEENFAAYRYKVAQ